jgi:hypothetical protein
MEKKMAWNLHIQAKTQTGTNMNRIEAQKKRILDE